MKRCRGQAVVQVGESPADAWNVEFATMTTAGSLSLVDLKLLGLEALEEGVAVFDVNERLVYANASFARMHRAASADELIGRSGQSFRPAQVVEMSLDDISVKAHGRRELEGSTEGPQHVQLTVAPLRDGSGVRVGHVVCTQDITARKAHESILARDALHDTLTDLPNRRLLLDSLDTAVLGRSCSDSSVGLLFIDLDDFKAVNDSYGHAVGDDLLCVLAQRMAGCIRADDLLARMGGDEFVVLLREVEDLEVPVAMARRIVQAVLVPVRIGSAVITVSVSIGVAVSSTASSRALLHHADTAMYDAKIAGPGRVVTHVAEANG
jgi:diguanylate cyclase (GGDEF)-like protein